MLVLVMKKTHAKTHAIGRGLALHTAYCTILAISQALVKQTLATLCKAVQMVENFVLLPFRENKT